MTLVMHLIILRKSAPVCVCFRLNFVRCRMLNTAAAAHGKGGDVRDVFNVIENALCPSEFTLP